MKYRVFVIISMLFFSQAASADIWAGYGRMKVNKVYVATGDEIATNPPAVRYPNWATLSLGAGTSLNDRNLGLSADVLLSEEKKLAEQTHNLTSGGVTQETKVVKHYGLFLGLRYKISKKFVLSGGTGVVGQETRFHYNPESTYGNESVNVYFNSQYLGVSMHMSQHFLAQLRQYHIDSNIRMTSLDLVWAH